MPTKINVPDIDKMKVSEVLPVLKYISLQWGLRLNRLIEYKIAVKILKKSLKYN